MARIFPAPELGGHLVMSAGGSEPDGHESVETILPTGAQSSLVGAQALPDGILDVSEDGILAGGIPVLVRGQIRIVPLATWTSPEPSPHAQDLWRALTAACVNRAGNWSLLDLDAERDDAIGAYAEALRAVAASRVRYWIYSGKVAVALVRADGDGTSASSSLALHVVPEGWLFHRAPTAAPPHAIDVRWSWQDVVGLFEHDRGFSL